MPQRKKDGLWDIVKAKFEIPEDREPLIRSVAMKTFGGLLRNYKADLRAKYCDLETKTEEEIKELVPDRVNSDQWVSCVEKWCSEESQRVGMNNKRNHSRQTLLHTAGTKSFARVAAEMSKSDGVAPSRAKLFIKTHTRKDGSILTEETREKIEKINEKITQDPNAGTSNEDDIGWSKNDVYSEVFGAERNGRVRGVGQGPTPSQKTGSVTRSLRGLSIVSSSTSSRQSEHVAELTSRLQLQRISSPNSWMHSNHMPLDRMDQVAMRQLRNLIFVLQALAIILPLSEYDSMGS